MGTNTSNSEVNGLLLASPLLDSKEKGDPVVVIFDLGKTNKKVFLFNEDYRVVYEHSTGFPETIDEDGDPCENLACLEDFVFDSLRAINELREFSVRSINFATYGASFVFIGEDAKPVAPLYNYLKPFPGALKKQFYRTYGGEENFSKQTASPVLGSLNSGMQLYRMKYEKPAVFATIKYALHLPQYFSYRLTGKACSDLTSIGCHTGLWNFEKNNYHDWVYREGVDEKLAPVAHSTQVMKARDNQLGVGVGLHDSSAALIPYLVTFAEPFVLISTGTWCITLNPFNRTPLTKEELQHDCLNYLDYNGNPVKASRLFAGKYHEAQVERIANHFQKEVCYYNSVVFDEAKMKEKLPYLFANDILQPTEGTALEPIAFDGLRSFEEAYLHLLINIVKRQKFATALVMGAETKTIFVDGGFSKNNVYMTLLAAAFPGKTVFAASTSHATAVGAALAIHQSWNRKELPHELFKLKQYGSPENESNINF